MSLPAGQRRALATIEAELQAGEPRLTAMFAMFTRLNNAAETPGAESLGTPLARARHRIKPRLRPRGWRSGTNPERLPRRLRGRPPAFVQFAALLPVLLLIALPAIVLSLSRPVRHSCQAAPPMRTLATVLVHRRTCPPGSLKASQPVDRPPLMPAGGK